MTGWNFADIYEVLAEEIPDFACLIQGERKVTWHELDRRARSIAAFLVQLGLKRQAKVAQYLYNAPEYLESIIAAFKGSFVPMNTNFRYGPDELTYLWTNGDVAAVIFHGSFASTIAAMRHRIHHVQAWLWVDDGTGDCPDWAVPYETAAAFEAAPDWRPWPVDGDDLFLLYTGGTTGLPKGVMWRQDDLFIRLNTENGSAYPENQNLDYLRSRISHKGRSHLSAGPLMHGAGLLTCFMVLALGGAVTHLTKRNFDPEDLLDTVERDHVASLMWVGDAFAKPVLEVLDTYPSRWNLSSLRVIISSGVVFSAEIKQGILRHIPSATISDVFGSSETMSLGRSVTSLESPTRTATFKAKSTTRVIDDRDHDVPAGSGRIGLLAIGGRQPIGYYNDPEKSRSVFRMIDGQRYVVAGDWARVEADGTIVLVGRGSECINTGGEKVFPEEVEIVLRVHPAVEDAVVVGVPDARFGQAVAAVVQPKPGIEVDDSEIASHVKASLAGYKAPRHIIIVEHLLRGPNGKPDLSAIRKLATNVLAAKNTDDRKP